uniref:TECT1 protein n=1 Tax=Macrostomum lignano TaxID=282301 RepID=A0A1I8GF32_9PLAT
FGLFSNLSCAQPLSPWWQSQCDGKNLIKLAADSNGAPRWMPDLPADSGVSVRMRLFAPKMILDDIEPGNVGDPCTTDFDCSSENRTACVPRGDLLTPQCSCANLPDQSLSVCNITIDMSVIFINATFEIDPIRGMSSRYVATVRMKHFRGNADIPASSPPKVLANFFTYFLNKSSAVYPPADPIFYFKHNPVTLIQGDLHAGHKLYEEFEFDISTDFVTPKGGQCWSSSYLCIGLLATENETVRDMNPNNNALCLDIDGYKTCQPECDTELLKANLTSLTPNPIERHKNVVVAYNLTVRVNNASFPILELSSDVNFNVTLHFVTSDCTSFGTDDVLIQRCLDDSVLKIPLLVTNEAIFKAHYSQGDNFSFSVQSPQFEVNQTQCNTTTHLCILFRNSVNSTYTEVYLSNNIACQSVATYCDIFSDISLDAMTVIPGLKFNPWIPEYRHNETIEFLVRNSGGSRIDPVVSSSINFSPYVTLHFTDDLGTVISIMESAKCADKDTQLGLQSGATMTMQCTVAFILKFDQCINSTHRNMTICADMINWVSPSFIDENLANNRRCIDAPKPFIREGLPIINQTITNELVVLPDKSYTFLISWKYGTYVDCDISLEESINTTWNWRKNGSLDSFRGQNISITYLYSGQYREFSYNVYCRSNISEFNANGTFLVSPAPAAALKVEAYYERLPAPNNVTFFFGFVNEKPGSFLKVTCTVTLYSNRKETYSNFFIYYDEPPSISYIYEPGKSVVTSNVRCTNTGGAYSKNFELRLYTPFEIEGVEIKINKSVLLTSEQFPLQLTVQNGTDVTYTVKMTDGTSQVIVHPEPVSYAQPINITHTFNAPGVYDIHVLASSPMNNESSTVSGIIVQNPIAAVAQSAYFHTATPTIYFPVTHTGAVPTNVSCKVNLAAGPEFSLLNQFQNVSASKSTETVTLECPPNLIAEEMTLSVRCWNLVSQYAKNSTVVCNEPVSGLTANASHVFVQPGQNLSITIRVSNGTSVELTTRFGDSTPNSVTFHPSKYASSNEIVLAHSYSTAGNYTVIVNASNPVSWKTAQINPIVVLNPLINVSVTYRQSVLWPYEMVQFVLNNLPSMEAGLVLCDFQFSIFGSKRIFAQSLTGSSNISVSFQYPAEAIGIQLVSMWCRSPVCVNGVTANFSLNLLLDSVRIANLSTNRTVWIGMPTEFMLDMTRVAYETCIEVYYNASENPNEIFGVSESCRSIATRNNATYTIITQNDLQIKWKRVFPVVGVIPVFVFAFNNVSNDSAQTFATVIDIPCYKPRLRLFDLDASPLQVTSVLTKRRSEQVNLTAVAPYNCSKLTNISTYWTIIAVQSSIELPLCTDNSDQCLVQRRVLPYGLYNVSFTAELTVDAAMAETAWILLNVSKTPLSLEAITGPEYVSFNQTFVLNASATATDFDVEDGDLSGMTFQWSCFRPEESDSANTISIPSQTEARALSELRGCFGNGPGVVYLGNASIAGSLTVNSFDLVPNASYVFRVRLTKDTREVWQSKTVFVESQPKPVGRLDCEQNCGAKVVAKRPLVYRLVCEQNCGHKFFTVSSNLTIVRLGVSGYEIEGTRQSSSDGQELSISAGTLMESSYYRVMGQLWNLGQEISNLVANITVNGPPVGGTCRVDPPGVISRKTNVQLLCKNWTEFGAAVAPLLYESMLILPQSGKRYSLFSSTNAVSPRVMLPLGDSSWAVVQFVVSDSFGAQQYYNFTFS